MRKKAIVLGGGISGLGAALTLSKTHEVLLFEKERVAGGWFLKSAQTFRKNSCKELLALAEELGLAEEIIYAAEEAKRRFLLFGGKLVPMPRNFFDFFRSPLLQGTRKAVLKEWRQPVYEGDETLFDFAARRFGQEIAERFFDPLAIGIFATTSKKLSVEMAFPFLKMAEKKHGSLTKAFLLQKKDTKSSLFSFRGGTQTLVKEIVDVLGESLCFGEEALCIHRKGLGVEVVTQKGCYQADVLVMALPAHVAGTLLSLDYLSHLEMTSLRMVQLGYREDLLAFKGFGYLVPTIENLPLLGVMFNSSIFPSENSEYKTLLTAMLPPLEQAEEIALQMIRSHLGIARHPDLLKTTVCDKAIFVPQIGMKERIQDTLNSLWPNVALAGNYLLEGASVNACLRSGFAAAKKLQSV